jgi:hypothetical protein
VHHRSNNATSKIPPANAPHIHRDALKLRGVSRNLRGAADEPAKLVISSAVADNRTGVKGGCLVADFAEGGRGAYV